MYEGPPDLAVDQEKCRGPRRWKNERIIRFASPADHGRQGSFFRGSTKGQIAKNRSKNDKPAGAGSVPMAIGGLEPPT